MWETITTVLKIDVTVDAIPGLHNYVSVLDLREELRHVTLHY